MPVAFSNPSRRRNWLASLLICLALVLISATPHLLTQSGLFAPVPVAPFLNGAMPANTPGVSSGAWVLEDAFPDLTFNSPMFLCQEPGSNRLYVAEKRGRIYAFNHSPSVSSRTEVLNIQSNTDNGGESGLLSFAFHPQYPDSNYLYAFYQRNGTLHSRISRFTINPATDQAVPNSELVLIHQRDEARNHNGGSLFFGNDGYLYISMGDEGGGNNVYDNGQVLDDELFGGVLRIDVDRNASTSHPIRRQPNPGSSYTQHYFIPNDNPWLDTGGGLLEEFVALGLRNPHRMTYDAISNTIWAGDVGQSSREEINLIEMGKNYQWGYREGTRTGPDPIPATLYGTDQGPVYEYPTSQGRSVTGGYIYRGSMHPDLQGQYIFADYVSRRVWAMTDPMGASPSVTQLMSLATGGSLSSFGVDAAQELYVLELGNNGKIWRLNRQNPGAPEPPALLSQTGAFTDLANMTPASFLIPYTMNQPFWSDGAIKSRYLILPNDGTHNTPEEQIVYAESGAWDWPEGTILIKHFEMEMDESNASVRRKLETRFMIKGNNSNFYGITYRWREDQTDAELLSDSWTDTLSIATANGPREVEWYYPSRGDCMTCHNEAAGGTLGLRTAQLNGDQLYPSTGITANQLKTLAHLSMFANAPDTTQLTGLPQAAPLDDNSLSLELRARTYLDANCAACHLPGNLPQAQFDARLETPLAQSGMVYGPLANDLGIAGARVIIPGDLEGSVLYQRLARVHEDIAMPPLAKNLLDTAGVQLIADWIQALDPAQVADCGGINFNDYAVQTYDPNQDEGIHSVLDGGATLFVSNNGWKKIDFPYTITANTILEFDFRSDVEGEEHAIGFDNNNQVDNNRFTLFGTQNVNTNLDFNTYAGNGAWQSFSIPVGNYYTGSRTELYFLADHDNSPGNGTSYFRNVKVYESSCNPLTAQAIDFAPLPPKMDPLASIPMAATASSGLPVTISVVSGPAEIINNELVSTGPSGRVVVRTEQPGNGSFDAAPIKEQTIQVGALGYWNGTGLTGTYFSDLSLTQQALTRTDPQINFFWGSGSPAPNLAYDGYSVRWEGEIEALVSGNHTFTARSDDGVRLWVNNQLIIDNWQDQAATEASGTITLTALQRVPIRVEYYERGVYAQAQLKWSAPGIPEEVIPSYVLYPTAGGSFPVEWGEFFATAEAAKVRLEWETLSERNTASFQIERSHDNRAFTEIGAVAAQGESAVLQSYQSFDEQPLPGVNYYRLRQLDLDGQFSFSEVREVYFDASLASLQLQVYPNP
ncbi:MAG: PQQ-dependent sugar dehydrogenase, partial [Bacteroidota bacterium]